jgi:predicted dehydrogenase
MPIGIGFIGFRHGHIHGMYNHVQSRRDVEIVGACEEDAETRNSLPEKGVSVTHHSVDAFLSEVECDVIACGDAYGRRGSILIRAMETGRHVIADKPLCTRLTELDQIESLSGEKDLRVGCMLDLVDLAPYQTLRRLLKEGAIGGVHAISFAGQHPLSYGSRPAWYFEEGMHGGTINDIAIHAVDCIPWLTGEPIVEVTAARAWNARLKEVPFFQDGAMLMLLLANDAGVLGDVSYLTPEGLGYNMPYYWRFNISGTEGHAETWCKADSVSLFQKGRNTVHEEPVGPHRPGGYFEDYLLDLRGTPNPNGLSTKRVLRSTRVALIAQEAADTGSFPRKIE